MNQTSLRLKKRFFSPGTGSVWRQYNQRCIPGDSIHPTPLRNISRRDIVDIPVTVCLKQTENIKRMESLRRTDFEGARYTARTFASIYTIENKLVTLDYISLLFHQIL